MVIEKEILVNKSIKDAWKVLGVDFANASKWASAVNHSEGNGEKFNGSTCSERGCSTTMGSIKEKLYEFSNENYSLAYEVSEGMPSMVKYATNTWKLVEVGETQCKLQIKMDIRMGGFFGSLLQPIMKMQMSKMGNHLVEDFAYYVENGTPHPRKIKALKEVKALKKYLTINSAFSALSGLIMLLFSNKLNSLFGIANAYVFPVIGANLLIFSLFVWFISNKQLTNKTLVTTITILDLLWVLGSFAIVLLGLFDISKTGNILISIVAIWIAFLAYKQFVNTRNKI